MFFLHVPTNPPAANSILAGWPRFSSAVLMSLPPFGNAWLLHGNRMSRTVLFLTDTTALSLKQGQIITIIIS